MEAEDHFFILENRLASFRGPQLVNKRKSAAPSKKTVAWPHSSPTPNDLAHAGFFFNPTPTNPDNVRCYLCLKDLDGWEEEDDPLQEHLKHSPSCGWAICAAIERELGDVVNEDPRQPYLLDARKATFAGRWPYESKKGWKCKTKQMAEAGWKYTPTLESDDNTTCTYCQLGLDGWESGDKPLDEHKRRAPNCPFFLMTRQPLKKQPRGKSARASKASSSRLSVQSAQSVADTTTDNQSFVDADESIMTVATAMTSQTARQSTAAPSLSASTSRARKTATGTAAKGRKGRGKKEELVVVEDSILEEPVASPEPADASLPTPKHEKALMNNPAPEPVKAPVKGTRGRKRASEQAQTLQPLPGKKRSSEEIEAPQGSNAVDEAPAPKRRATRTRASSNIASAQNGYGMFDPAPADVDEAAIEAELRALEQDMAVNEPEPEIQVPKKGRKAGTRKVSKQATRKIKETTPIDEPMPEPEAELAPEPAEAQVRDSEPPAPDPKPTKAKRGRPRKASQQPQPPPPPPPPPPQESSPEAEDHDMDDDELHEDSFTSNDTVLRHAGRPSKKSMDSVRSSVGNTSRVSFASAGSYTVPKITHIPPPSIPGMPSAAPPITTLSKRKSVKAPLPTTKKRLSLRDIEEREERELKAAREAEELARQEEALRQQAEREQAEREEAELEQAAREQAEREQAEREQAEREQAAREQAEREQAEREQAEREQAAREQAEREQAEREQIAREKAAREKAAREKAAREKAARDKAAREKAAREKAAREQAAREQEAREQEAREQEAREQEAREQAEREEAARIEAARQQAAREQAAREKAARDKAAREKAAREKAEKAAREKAAREQAEREQAEREQAEREQAEREQAEREQAEREQAEREQAEREEAARQQALREKAAREKAAKEKAAKEKAAKEKAAKEKAAREKAAKEQAAREKAAREKAAREQAEREQAEREQAEREQAMREEAERKEAARQQALREEEEAMMEEQLQREQLEQEQMELERLERIRLEKEQLKKQAPKKQSAKKPKVVQQAMVDDSLLSVAPTTPRKVSSTTTTWAKQATLSPSQSPQSSDAENQPPSSRPTSDGKKVSHVPIPTFPAPPAISAAAHNANVTPVRESPSKRTMYNGNTLGGLRGGLSWTEVDVDAVFELGGQDGPEDVLEGLLRKGGELTTPEKAMTVEEFIFHNASQAERLLKEDCEAMVSEFEKQGSRAMRVLESLEVGE